MRFFLPAATDDDQAETAYEAIRKFVVSQAGPVREQRYFAIYYTHNGRDLVAKVGEPEPLTGEMVIAIFRTERESGPFLICTPNRGVIRGEPILADGSHSTRAIHFEPGTPPGDDIAASLAHD